MKLYDINEYVSGVLAGKRRMLAKTITLVESNDPSHEKFGNEVIERLLDYTGKSIRLGISGVPGVGKSTFIENLGMELIRRGKKVAVLAVDPSSQISHGSIMGDKTRMEELAAENSAFIRPSPSSGSLGGVARKTRETMLLCEAAGYDVVIIETVGVGQSEVMVGSMVDFFLVMMLPNAGDDLQGIKKGIMEFADTIIVNKADGDNVQSAKMAKRQYDDVLHILSNASKGWTPKAMTCSALNNEGVNEFVDVLFEHNKIVSGNGYLESKRREQRKEWMWNIIQNVLQSMFRRNKSVSTLLEEIEEKILSDKIPPTKAAGLILDEFIKHASEVDTFWKFVNG